MEVRIDGGRWGRMGGQGEIRGTRRGEIRGVVDFRLEKRCTEVKGDLYEEVGGGGFLSRGELGDLYRKWGNFVEFVEIELKCYCSQTGALS